MSLKNKTSWNTAAEKKYIQIMKEKSGEERLRLALELRKLALKLTESGIKAERPNISEEEVRQEIFKRIYGTNLPFKVSNK